MPNSVLEILRCGAGLGQGCVLRLKNRSGYVTLEAGDKTFGAGEAYYSNTVGQVWAVNRGVPGRIATNAIYAGTDPNGATNAVAELFTNNSGSVAIGGASAYCYFGNLGSVQMHDLTVTGSYTGPTTFAAEADHTALVARVTALEAALAALQQSE